MRVLGTVSFVKLDSPEGEMDYTITFIRSGYEGIWLKVWEGVDYSISVYYASDEENKTLNERKEQEECALKLV